MKCPRCESRTKVFKTQKRLDYVKRYRECLSCSRRFTTIEMGEWERMDISKYEQGEQSIARK